MDRYWLLTWTTYGTWLPGDARGFVSPVEDGAEGLVIHNVPGTPYDADLPALQRAARLALAGEPILLQAEQAETLMAQFHETAAHRHWLLCAAAIMANHVHVVVGVPGDPEPASLLQSFKSYGSRALNRLYGKPASPTWWTESGSRRKLPDESAVRAAMEYVRWQAHPLRVWTASGGC
jgi:REP element-mobilizing transposase RayT